MAADLRLLQIAICILILFANLLDGSYLEDPRRQIQDQTSPDSVNRCGGNCPCFNLCAPPPPPPIKPRPPPTTLSPPPPPSPRPAPPTPPYAYTNAPPGNIYQVYPYYSGVGRRRGVSVTGLMIAWLWVMGI